MGKKFLFFFNIQRCLYFIQQFKTTKDFILKLKNWIPLFCNQAGWEDIDFLKFEDVHD